MTKQPPFVTRLRLSRICRWLLALGLIKLCIFGALVAGYPLPEISLDFWRGEEKTVAEARQPSGQSSSLTLSGTAQESTAATSAHDNAAPANPQGAAAARAAAALSAGKNTPAAAPLTSAAPLPTLAADKASVAAKAQTPAGTPHSGPATTLAPAVDSARTAASDTSWWSRMTQLQQLPFPRLGLDQVAHAATLDAPPSPALPAATGASPFLPPGQAIPSGTGADGAPIPMRPTTAQPRPAGTAGPQLDGGQGQQGGQGGIPAMLTPTDRPPTPRVDGYVPPEDPNRKQQELARREQEVLVLKQQMEQRLTELQEAERKVQSLLEEAKEAEAKKVSRLSAMYINMKPKQAAKALESMDERTAVKILAGMSPKQSGEILTYADPVKTAKLTELISRMRASQ